MFCGCGYHQKSTLEACKIQGDIATLYDTVWSADFYMGKVRLLYISDISVRHFNEDGFLLSQVVYNYYGDITKKEEWTYKNRQLCGFKNFDGKGQLKSSTRYDNENGLVKKDLTEFFGTEEKQDPVQTFYYYTKDRLDSLISRQGGKNKRIVYEYLDRNNSYRETTTDYSGLTSSITVWIDGQANMYKQAAGLDTFYLQYDTIGNVSEFKTKQSTTLFKYKYDEHKNWVEQVHYQQLSENEDPVVKMVVKRGIVYREC